MLVGRAENLAQLDRLVADLLAGHGRVLVLRGEPGIGKTTLLDALVERCAGRVTVLRARGVETESELAFCALSDLLGPLADQLQALPAPQAAALAGALALGPPQPGDRLALCVATLGALRAAGRTRPLLAVVDDLHWVDAASRECVLYAARRAGGALAFVLAVRSPSDADLEHVELPELTLAPLGRRDSLDLLARAAPDLSGRVARSVADAAAGNPLDLLELLVTLNPEQRAGAAGLDLPLAPGRVLKGAFGRRIEAVPRPARMALLVAATYGGDDLATIAAACEDGGGDVRRLAEAEARGLISIDGERAAFAHPLIRGAVCGLASAAERRAAHRALAGALQGEQRAWHLAHAAVGPDAAVADELEQAAGAVAARRGFASATAALERAARLSPTRAECARRLLAAGETAGAAGKPDRALALLAEASRTADDGSLRARAVHRRGSIMLWSGAVEPAAELLQAEAERVAQRDVQHAAVMLADAAAAYTGSSRFRDAQALAERAARMLRYRGDAVTRAHVLAILGYALVLRGKTRRAEPLLAEAGRLGAEVDYLAPNAQWKHLLLQTCIQTGELERARDEGTTLCERAREAGAFAALGGALAVVSDAAFRLGDWKTADAASLEAILVSDDTGQHVWRGLALTSRARLAAARGHDAESRRAGQDALALAESAGISSGRRYGHGALGFLELGLDRVSAAIAELETVERLSAESGADEPTAVPWAADLAEAYIRAGRDADARRVLAMLRRQVASTGSVCTRAVLARCRGLLEDDFEAAFVAALEFDQRRPMPFERARTLLGLGQRLRRSRRRSEARERLREAHASFERLGAAAWAAHARDELRAAGARRRPARTDHLTPQEERVAAAVTRGASNREIAAELFLAPKTIEFHLHQIYRKLGVRSRTQLTAKVARERVPADP